MSGEAGSHLEIERKYDVDEDFVLPDLSGLPSVTAVEGPRTYRLRALYLDTADRRLAAARITLRRRTGGADAGWHLKLPAGPQSRQEMHAPLGRGPGTVPPRLAALVAGTTGGLPLQPIARLSTTRRLRRLTGPDGRLLAEVADDLVTGATGTDTAGTALPAITARWREVEVELASGPASLLDLAEVRLRQAGARPASAGSKLARLLAAAPPA